MTERHLIIGTRGSTLALAQTELVSRALQEAHPGLEPVIQTIRTQGDRDRQTPLRQIGGQGIFVKEIERALLRGETDIAVHSLKDMPSVRPPGLTIAAVLPREDPRDALVSPSGLELDALLAGARVGTGSLRRQAQLRAHRPDLLVIGIRGNVDTRLQKVLTDDYDAVVLAVAGLRRLGRADRITQILPLDLMLPAVGQGAIAVEARAGDDAVLELLAAIDHRPSHLATTAEQAFLRRLAGGCRVPIAAHATLAGDDLTLRALVADVETGEAVRGDLVGPAAEAEALGSALAQRLIDHGAARLLGKELSAS